MLAILGYTDREIRTFIFRANYILVPLGFLLGVPLGYATAYSMILSADRIRKVLYNECGSKALSHIAGRQLYLLRYGHIAGNDD